MPSLSTLSAGVVLVTLLPRAFGHMAIYHPSVYGFGEEKGLIHELLSGQSFDGWWFHGYAFDTPSEVMTITAGQPLTVGISCRKVYSEYGDKSDKDACPLDSGAYHAGGTSFVAGGWGENDESLLMGCALAISPTSDAASTKPEDFIIMSVHPGKLPNLPACPEGGCTCAWFWQGHNSQDEMYMSGYRCNVENGVASAWPTPAKPKRGAISGPTQPLYWANDAASNNLDYSPTYETRPSYNKRFGFTNGAQTSAFGAGGAAAPAKPVAGTTKSATTPKPVASKGTNGEPQAITPKPPADAAAPVASEEEEDEGDTEDEEKEEPEAVPLPSPVASSRRTRPTGGWSGKWRNKNKGNTNTKPVTPSTEVDEPSGDGEEAPAGANNYAAIGAGDAKPSASAVEPCEEGDETPAGASNLVAAGAGDDKSSGTSEEACEEDDEAPAGANNLVAAGAADIKPSSTSTEPCEDVEKAPANANNLVTAGAADVKSPTSNTEPCEDEEEAPGGANNLVAAGAADPKPSNPVVAAESGDGDGITDDDYEKDDEDEGGDADAGEKQDSTPVPLPSPIPPKTPTADGGNKNKNIGNTNTKPTGTAAEVAKPSIVNEKGDPAGSVNFEDVDAGDDKSVTPVVADESDVGSAVEGAVKGAVESGKLENSGEINDDDYEKDDVAGGGAAGQKGQTSVVAGEATDTPAGTVGDKSDGTAGGGDEKPCDKEEKNRRSRLFR